MSHLSGSQNQHDAGNTGRVSAQINEIRNLSFDHVDTLIKIISTPGYTPQEIHAALKRFQELQQSFDGWEFARRAFDHDSETYQFWGASTFVVKIKADWESLDSIPNAHEELLLYLLGKFEDSIKDAGSHKISRKLYSALAAYFLRPTFDRPWFRLILLGPSYTEAIHADDHAGYIRNFINSMSPKRLTAVIAVSTNMVEETLKIEARQQARDNSLWRLTQDIKMIFRVFLTALTFVLPRSRFMTEAEYQDFGALERFAHWRGINHLHPDDSGDFAPDDPTSEAFHSDTLHPEVDNLAEEAISSLQTWLPFIDEHVSIDQVKVHSMARRCTDLMLACLNIMPLFERAAEASTNIVRTCPAMLHLDDNPVLLESLHWLALKYLGSFTPKDVSFVTFLFELANTEDYDDPGFLENQILTRTLSLLHTLLDCAGVPGVEDELCYTVFEIWTKVADGLREWDAGERNLHEHLFRQLDEVVDAGMKKIKYPDSPDWDADDRSKVYQFERDFEEFLIVAFPSLGFALWDRIAFFAAGSLQVCSWPDLAASLFCLCSLAEAVDDRDDFDGLIQNMFNNTNWPRICHGNIQPDDKAQKWITVFVARYSGFFQRHLPHLLLMMNFLFNSLRPANSRSAASKAISTLCHACRSALSHNLDDLLSAIENTRFVAIEDEVRLFKAAAAVIQSLHPESVKLGPLKRLLSPVAKEYGELTGSIPQDADAAQNLAMEILLRLSSVGKGLRTPEDEPIDLDAEPHDHANPPDGSDFWFFGEGRSLKDGICTVIEGLATIFPSNAIIIEGICEVLRAGYTEKGPSLYGFMPSVSRNFVVTFCKPNTPGVSSVMRTASAFLASHAHKPAAILEDYLMIVKAVVDGQATSIVLGTETYDHDFASYSLDFLTAMLPKYGSLFFQISDAGLGRDGPAKSALGLGQHAFWKATFLFPLTHLGSSDTFPKRSAAKFWTAILDIAGQPSNLQSQAMSNATELIRHFAPDFTKVLLGQLTGDCSRSEIDNLCEPLRKYIAKHSLLANGHLTSIMANPTALPTKVQDPSFLAQRMTFVKQIMGLRGAKKTNEIARDFWIRCRGSEYAYTA